VAVGSTGTLGHFHTGGRGIYGHSWPVSYRWLWNLRALLSIFMPVAVESTGALGQFHTGGRGIYGHSWPFSCRWLWNLRALLASFMLVAVGSTGTLGHFYAGGCGIYGHSCPFSCRWLWNLRALLASFMPVAVESTGTLGQDATEFRQELGGCIAASTCDPRSSEFCIAIQCSNAACVLSTCVLTAAPTISFLFTCSVMYFYSSRATFLT